MLPENRQNIHENNKFLLLHQMSPHHVRKNQQQYLNYHQTAEPDNIHPQIADAVQIGAANLVDPWVCKKIIERLPSLMEELGISSLKEIKGCAK